MKRNAFTPALIAILTLSLTLSSCSYRQYSAVAGGASLGGLFGSSIGRLTGGPRGGDRGTIAGMLIGGAIGAAATAEKNKQSTQDNTTYYQDDTYTSSQDVSYGSYRNYNYRDSYAEQSDLAALEIRNVQFLDENNNRKIDYNEKAYLVFDIYNNSSKTLYNVAPTITCSSKRVAISSAATVSTIQSGQGIRYKAAVLAVRRLGDDTITFTISFGEGSQKVVAKTFSL